MGSERRDCSRCHGRAVAFRGRERLTRRMLIRGLLIRGVVRDAARGIDSADAVAARSSVHSRRDLRRVEPSRVYG